jgi:hypothetical protein
MNPCSLGRDYVGRVGAGFTTTGTGIHVESSLLGAKVGLRDGVEVHVLCFTLGIGIWTPSIKTPLGCVGW